MIRYIISLLALSIGIEAHADCNYKPLRIAVIDTGFGFYGHGTGANLCKTGHRDFSSEQVYTNKFNTIDPVPIDVINHGTNIVGIIKRGANFNNANYCIVIIKYYSTKNFESINPKLDYKSANQKGSENALKYLNTLKPDIVNYSGGGSGYDSEEASATREYLDSGGIFVAAAGNENKDLDKNNINAYFPAMYDSRIIVVGSIDQDGDKSYFSNYGKIVKRWEYGSNVEGYGLSMSGTSQATAIATGKIIGQTPSKCVE